MVGKASGRLKGELVAFWATDSIRLNGFLVQQKPTKKCVIYLHGMDGNFYGSLQSELARHFNAAGFAMFSINTRGHDRVASLKKEKGGSMQYLIGGTGYERFEDSALDIEGAMRTLSKLGFRRFVLCGHSTGCQKAVYYQYRRNDKRIVGIALLAPVDDYNFEKHIMGNEYGRLTHLSESLLHAGHKDELIRFKDTLLSAQRLDSLVSLERAEARIFNYKGDLREFGKIKVPVYATFGSKEEYALKDVDGYLKLLGEKTSSAKYTSSVISGTDHSFKGKREVLGRQITGWLRSLGA